MAEDNGTRRKMDRPKWIRPIQDTSPYRKCGQGSPYRGQARKLVVRVRIFFFFARKIN